MTAAPQAFQVRPSPGSLRELQMLTGKADEADAVMFAIRFTVKSFQRAEREARLARYQPTAAVARKVMQVAAAIDKRNGKKPRATAQQKTARAR